MEEHSQLALVGATGMVGREIVAQLAQRDYSAGRLSLFASARSEAEEVEFGEETLPVEKVEPRSFKGARVVILATPASEATGLALAAQQEGAWVVDVSGAFLGSQEVPWVAPKLNEGVLDKPFAGRIVSLASPLSQLVAFALEPVRRALEISDVQATLLLGSASAGNAGQRTLEKQTADLMGGREPEVAVFPHRLGYNIIPEVGGIAAGQSAQERSVILELTRLWGSSVDVTPTLLWVPTFHGVVATLSAHTGKAWAGGDLAALFKGADCVQVLDKPEEHIYPMPMLATGDASVHVGRLRYARNRLHLVAAVDNVGCAANGAIDVALKLASRS
ncbi:MAG: aspartate-semialdehyde dehydrogenase [Myxococcaceae bacterium]|nr:aspartate-semialdehyde dehydrogenase [Myxococcaceae bacterium]